MKEFVPAGCLEVGNAARCVIRAGLSLMTGAEQCSNWHLRLVGASDSLAIGAPPLGTWPCMYSVHYMFIQYLKVSIPYCMLVSRTQGSTRETPTRSLQPAVREHYVGVHAHVSASKTGGTLCNGLDRSRVLNIARDFHWGDHQSEALTLALNAPNTIPLDFRTCQVRQGL
jgi:hypothetical protein